MNDHLELDLVRFDNSKSVQPKRHRFTWRQLRENLTNHQESETKDVGLWSPTLYRENATRGKDGVVSLSCFVLDLDGVQLEVAKPYLEPFDYFAHTTWSHRVERECWRVVLPFAQPVPASEWEATWYHLNGKLGNLSDSSTKDASRGWYLPSHQPGHDFDAFHHPGVLLDSFTAQPRPLATVSDVLEFWEMRRRRGQRHETMLTCQLALVRLETNGADVNEALARIERDFTRMILDRATPQEAQREWDESLRRAREIVAKEKRTHTSTGTADTSTDDGEKPETKRRQSVADVLVRLAQTRYRFTVGDDGDALAIPLNGSPLAKPLRGDGSFQDDLARLHHRETGKVPATNSVKEAVSVLGGIAREKEREPVYYRRADLNGRLVVDIGETTGAVVEIDGDGWRILETSPVVFRRSETLGRLERPTTANLDAFREFVPADEAEFRQVVAWLVASHFDVPRPILFPEADQGAGKTTLVRRLKRLTDPSHAEVNPAPRDERHWRTLATNSHVAVFDNVSRIEAWLSDALCRAVTGDGAVERTLYTDNAPKVYAFRRAMILTSIHLSSLRGDLTERLLPVRLRRIPDHQRRTERELDDSFQEKLPEILAGLYELTAKVLARLHHVELRNPPRMADFARILRAIDYATGWDTFSTYGETTRSIVAHVAENDEVGSALLDYAKSLTGTTTHTTKELLEIVRERTRFTSQTFPRDAQQLGKRLSYLAEPLRKAGVVIERPAKRSRTEQRWTLTVTR
ncbi:MAG: hypothetical protein EB101_07535, partial [Chitinophagia bacterium]|nr:hypothetical protein [Chitinophagia bacterium]